MKCPYCGHDDQRVLESRPARDGEAVRRRRECSACNRRFTTFEQPEKPRLFVVKRGGVREEFDRQKMLDGMANACHKRPVPAEELQLAAERIEQEMFDLCEPEVASKKIGDRVMEELLRLDPVAFVRFASVYREFDSPQEFAKIVTAIRKAKSDVKDPGVAASIVRQLV
ncbi:MAG TPA: transcriptional regulator NrdR [Fimbriimonadaceae bacterium]|nr:transcriptional regulator NrdR [Fimbriimonadaceae bacterium]